MAKAIAKTASSKTKSSKEAVAKAPPKTKSVEIASKSKSSAITAKSARGSAGKVVAKARKSADPSLAPRSVSQEERRRMIELAAYHIAERDGFQPGRESDYWAQGEAQISRVIGQENSALAGSSNLQANSDNEIH